MCVKFQRLFVEGESARSYSRSYKATVTASGGLPDPEARLPLSLTANTICESMRLHSNLQNLSGCRRGSWLYGMQTSVEVQGFRS